MPIPSSDRKEAILKKLKLHSYYAEEIATSLGISLQLTKDLLRELEAQGQVEKYGSLIKPVWRLR